MKINKYKNLGIFSQRYINTLRDDVYNGGNKRKVSTLLASMVKSMIVLLDEPTTVRNITDKFRSLVLCYFRA